MQALIDWLDGMTFWRWFGLAGLMFVAELLTGTTYLLWFAVAAGMVGVLMILPLGLSWEVQFIAFAVFSIGLIAMGRSVLKPGWLRSAEPTLNDAGAQLRGRTVAAVEAFAGPYGRVRLGDSEWRALQVEGGAIAPGDQLEVIDVDGATLKVRKA
jgi:membrane protein implicated in regulation of membrane protease activity